MTIELDDTARMWLDSYRKIKNQIVVLTDALNQCTDHLKAAVGDNDEATVDGDTVISYRYSKGASRIDVKALREKEPDLAEQFTITGEPVRKFTVTDGA